MSIEKTHAQVIASIWQSIAQSEVDLSSITPEDQKTLVYGIADSVMLAFDEIIGHEVKNNTPAKLEIDDDEHLIWEGRPFLSLTESYVITSERIKIITGLISRHVEVFELIRVQDIDYKQSVGERVFGLGDIFIRGQDASEPAIVLRNVAKPEEVYETLRKAWLVSRKRHGLQFREYM
ncbi:MAG: PH domain-containing protein [Chloroflexota bacterium]|nr:MAG: hypothetical protein B6243_12915 [Anaerolineaceae bacterium 4572_5.2]RLD08453.1 MAG: PH domain-containing protein [Chloroflexota bacterium]